MERVILVLSTMDTKGPETMYLRDRIREAGGFPLVLDMGMSGSSEAADISSEAVARAAGADINEIRSSRERRKITRQMIDGASVIGVKMLEEGRLAGVIGLGGSTASLMASDVMRSLPFGVPKLMVSSTAALPGLSTRYIGTGDLAILHTVIEISGLTSPLKNVLDRAAAAIASMARVESFTVESARQGGKPLVAMSMFGPTEKCAHHVRQRLELEGFQVIGFSAAGVCDRAMEDMISRNFFDAVVDLAPGGVGEEALGGMRAAGPHRLTSAGKIGIPQVIAPGGVNLMSPRKSRYKPEYYQRKKFDMDELRTFLRLSVEEMEQVADIFAEKVNASSGRTIVVFPKRGWSAIDAPPGDMFEPEEDEAFFRVFTRKVHSRVGTREVDANLEETAFADAVVDACLEIFPHPRNA
ncbi:MAG TPA: Tm-1-like ATP-binding domain-containing protein [Desulfomonilaceae bacterium]|nr:Tm-1-like ATP-binding domain-containing protein [Desulfomonilaceae bacterium]